MVESAESFGKYTLLEKVAVGGMAEIYRAKTQGLGGFEKLLAIKRLHPQFGEEHDVAQMLVDEARIAVHLTHPNIAQIFDLGCIRDQYFIAMEYIDGVDMHQANKKVRERGGEIPVPALVFAISEALGGLHYAHTRKDAEGKPLQIVHRDVSPQNIMISYEGEVKIVDFGIAKAESRAQEDTQHGIIKGKFYYMSPEQAYGHRIDARTDIFAAGMVLYELLAGKNPYTRVEEYELLKAVRKADFPPLSTMRPDVDPQLEQIVSRATARDANARYETAREMQKDLMAYLDANFGPYRRMELAKFIRSVGNPRGAYADDSAVMSRDDFEATEASMIFEAGSVLRNDADFGTTEEDKQEANPFAEEEPTQLWTPDAPPPVNSGEPPERAPLGQPPSLFDSEFDGPASFDAADAPPNPTAGTKEKRVSLLARLIPESVERTHLIFVVLGVLVLGLGGVLAFLLLSGGGAQETQPAVEPVPAVAQGENSATAATSAPEAEQEQKKSAATVDVRIVSTPPGADVHLDGRAAGTTPVVLEELSTSESYELMLSFADGRSLERTIQPTLETSELALELPEARAVLKVATYPPNATIKVDGEAAGQSPVDVAGLSRTEAHTVVATLEDGREVSRTIEWKKGDDRVKQIELQFDSTEEGEEVDKTATAKKVEAAPKRKTRRSPRKRRRRTSTKPSRSKASSKSLDIWDDGSNSKTAAKKERKSGSSGSESLDIWGDDKGTAKGTLAVTIEGEAKVYVDGKLVSGDTSKFSDSLDAGTYSVRVYFSRLKRYSPTKRIRVQGGKTSSVSFRP